MIIFFSLSTLITRALLCINIFVNVLVHNPTFYAVILFIFYEFYLVFKQTGIKKVSRRFYIFRVFSYAHSIYNGTILNRKLFSISSTINSCIVNG